MSPDRRPGPSLDDEVVTLLLDVMVVVKDDFLAVAAREELTPSQALVLRLLDESHPMRELAQVLDYDASTITAIIDKLEHRSLVERQADPTDRRVRRIELTEAGRALRTRLDRALHEHMSILQGLDDPAKRQLRDLLNRALGDQR